MAFTAFLGALRPMQSKSISSMMIFNLRRLLEGIERDRRRYIANGKWSRQILSGLRHVIVFEEVTDTDTGCLTTYEEKLQEQCNFLLKKLPILPNANLADVIVCAFHRETYQMDPDLFDDHCEMIEEMFLSLGKEITEWKKLKAFPQYGGKSANLWSKCIRAFRT